MCHSIDVSLCLRSVFYVIISNLSTHGQPCSNIYYAFNGASSSLARPQEIFAQTSGSHCQRPADSIIHVIGEADDGPFNAFRLVESAIVPGIIIIIIIVVCWTWLLVRGWRRPWRNSSVVRVLRILTTCRSVGWYWTSSTSCVLLLISGMSRSWG